jgi:hypothetical protein
MNAVVEYLQNSVWATVKPSKIHGVGVVAIRDIPEGQVITDNGQAWGLSSQFLITQEDLQAIDKPIRDLILDRCLMFDKYIACSPNAQVDLRAFMNHSKTPNTDGFVTLRKIKEGEELTEDYTSFGELSTISKNHYDFL